MKGIEKAYWIDLIVVSLLFIIIPYEFVLGGFFAGIAIVHMIFLVFLSMNLGNTIYVLLSEGGSGDEC